jgi:AcrR family transcriptional regulator
MSLTKSTECKTHQALIEASYRLFVTRGYHATTMRDIANEVGITAGSIYNHFTDKDQIIKEVLLTYHPLIKVMPLLTEADGQSTEELIRDAAHRIVREVDRCPGILTLIAIEIIELENKHIPDLIKEIYPAIQNFLQRVYSGGAIIRPQNKLTFFRAFFGMLLGYSMSRLNYDLLPKSSDPDIVLEEHIDLFLKGVISSENISIR